ncbi:MAG: hypothetical protein E7593_03950 [Ruminococcaceae bacterium]|nr:hypothetical protein [Oscillospiraceae bacterium]
MVINVEVKNKIANYFGTDEIVCGNSDYKINFLFDEGWENNPKTALFVYVRNGVERVQEIFFEGNICEVPVLYNTTLVRVGVISGNVRTTTPATIKCKTSIACRDAIPETHEKDAYVQILNNIKVYSEHCNNNFASVVRVTTSGPAVVLDDISPIEHTMRVKAKSENLLDLTKAIAISGQEKIIIDGDNIILKDFGGSGGYGVYWPNMPLEIGKTYTISQNSVSNHSASWGWRISFKDDTVTILENPKITVTIDREVRNITLYVSFGEMTGTQDIIIEKPQCREGSEILPYVPFMDDLSTARVTRYGGSLIDLNYIEKISGTPTVNGDSLKISGYMAQLYIDLPPGTYTFHAKSSRTGDYGGGVSIMFYNGTTNLGDAYNFYKADILNPSYTFTMPQTANRVRIIFYGGNSTSNTSATYENVMLNLGTARGYEPYKQPTTHSINSDGTVEGVISLYPTTTLTTDTDGVVLDVEYNVDTKKYIDNEIVKKIAQLAAMIVNS